MYVYAPTPVSVVCKVARRFLFQQQSTVFGESEDVRTYVRVERERENFPPFSLASVVSGVLNHRQCCLIEYRPNTGGWIKIQHLKRKASGDKGRGGSLSFYSK